MCEHRDSEASLAPLEGVPQCVESVLPANLHIFRCLRRGTIEHTATVHSELLGAGQSLQDLAAGGPLPRLDFEEVGAKVR